MKPKLCILGVGLLSSCTLEQGLQTIDKIVEPIIQPVADVAINSGSSNGGLIGVGLLAVGSLYKWWRHKSNFKETVKSVQVGLEALTPAQKKEMLEKVGKAMPRKVREAVAKVKDTEAIKILKKEL